jgi:cytochrome c biogenesis protein CcmG/thiol:disulfide interchange protein DsbE
VLSSICLVAALAGCGSHARSAAPSPSRLQQAFVGSPPTLVRLHEQANRLLTGGWIAFDAELRRLARAGIPVVVSKWASWCVPCRSEFPAFQAAAVAYGKRVAFIGLDAEDASGSAAAFLRQFPVSYPSYEDPHEEIAGQIQASTYLPLTVYVDSHGRVQYVHAGGYTSSAALERDIRFYLHA